MPLRFGLKETTIEQLCFVFAHYPEVQQAILYGSRAKGTYKNGSDIDITLVGNDEALTLEVLYRIMEEIDELLLPYMVDLSLFHKITDTDVRNHIERVGQLLYESSIKEM